MKEICIDVRMGLHSGIGTYIRSIVSRLWEASFKIRLIATPEVLDKWADAARFDLILTSAPIYSVQEQLKMPLLVPACDLFWTPHYNVPFFPLRARKRLVTIHDVYHLAFGNTLSFAKRSYANVIMRRAVNVSDHILTISHFSKDEIVKYVKAPREKISPIHLGVDRSHFSPQLHPQPQIREKYGLPQNYFIFVSNLAPHKNIQRLLAAWQIVLKEFPNWKLVLVGKKGKVEIDSSLLLRKEVLLLGEVCAQDLPSLYQLAYAAIHPSLYEGFGLTPLEALSSGCPAIVSNAASLPEVCGKSAIYVDPYDVQDIAAGMRKLILDPTLRHHLSEQGLERSAMFTWEKTTEEHIKVLERLVL